MAQSETVMRTLTPENELGRLCIAIFATSLAVLLVANAAPAAPPTAASLLVRKHVLQSLGTGVRSPVVLSIDRPTPGHWSRRAIIDSLDGVTVTPEPEIVREVAAVTPANHVEKPVPATEIAVIPASIPNTPAIRALPELPALRLPRVERIETTISEPVMIAEPASGTNPPALLPTTAESSTRSSFSVPSLLVPAERSSNPLRSASEIPSTTSSANPLRK